MNEVPEYISLNISDSFEKLPPNELSGTLISIWNCLENPKFSVRYVYMISCLPGKIKGPYCHSKRTALFVPVVSTTYVIYRHADTLKVLPLACKDNLSDRLYILSMPPYIDYCLTTLGTESSVIVLSNYPWRQQDDEVSTPALDKQHILELIQKETHNV